MIGFDVILRKKSILRFNMLTFKNSSHNVAYDLLLSPATLYCKLVTEELYLKSKCSDKGVSFKYQAYAGINNDTYSFWIDLISTLL